MLCQYICNSFGLLGSILIIVLYLGYPQIRIFAFKLVFFLAISSSGYNISILIGPSTSDSISCQVQATLISYFSVSTVLWLLNIIHSLKVSILEKRSPERFFKYYIQSAYLFPLLTSVIPASTGTFSRADYLGVCWIDPSTTSGKVLIFLQIWLLIVLGFVFTSFYSLKFIKTTRLLKSNPEESSEMIKYLNRLRPFTVIMFICWFFPVLHLIVKISSPSENHMALIMLHCIFSGSQGVLQVYCFIKDHSVYECLIDTFSVCLPCLMRKSKKNKKFELGSRA
jgi:uncharacterized protein YneF (UPF0154 family)